MKRHKGFKIFLLDIRNELCGFTYEWWEDASKYDSVEHWRRNCNDIEDLPSYEEIENFLKRFVPKELR